MVLSACLCLRLQPLASCFFFNDTATTEIYTLSLHDALPISEHGPGRGHLGRRLRPGRAHPGQQDRKSTRLNSSHSSISYAVFCLKKKQQTNNVRVYAHENNSQNKILSVVDTR